MPILPVHDQLPSRNKTIGEKSKARSRCSAEKVLARIDVWSKIDVYSKSDVESKLSTRKPRFRQKSWIDELSFGHYIWIESSKPLSFLSPFKNLELVFRTECMIWTNENYFSNFKFLVPLDFDLYLLGTHNNYIFREFDAVSLKMSGYTV